jgi:hypothetical protein
MLVASLGGFRMARVFAACAFLALGSVVAGAPPVAPAPRPVLPQISLIVVEEVTGTEGTVDTRRILRVGVRNGKLLPAETVWEGDQQFLSHFGGHRVVADRYFVTKYGGVIDLRDGKVLNKEQNREFCGTNGTKILYRDTNEDKVAVFSFDTATGKAKKESVGGDGKYAFPGVLSPDGMSAVESGTVADELVLHQVGAKPRSLGKGFHIDIGNLSSTFGPSPLLWLNDGLVLTQRGNGKIVTLDVAGKVTDVLTIKDAPKDLVGPPYLSRDPSGRIVYSCGPETYTLDLAKKTFAKAEWQDLGHGFEVSLERQPKFGYKLRHNGKEFGSINCHPHTAKTAPGLLALEAQYGQDEFRQPECVAVWSVDVGEWQTVKMWPNSVVGWVKP